MAGDNRWRRRVPYIEIPGGRYQLTARGNERRRIFRDDGDCHVVLGTEAFAERLRAQVSGNRREQPILRQLGRGLSWEEVVRALESVKAEPWEQFRDRHGDWGRDAALWLGRRNGRMTLRELGERAGGMDYNAVGAAVSRFGRRLATDRKLARRLSRLQTQLSNMKTEM